MIDTDLYIYHNCIMIKFYKRIFLKQRRIKMATHLYDLSRNQIHEFSNLLFEIRSPLFQQFTLLI